MPNPSRLALLFLCASGVAYGHPTAKSQRYSWRNVPIVAGGFITGITYQPKVRDLAYCRTDIGGAYRWDQGAGRWTPLLDWLTKKDWNLYGIEALAIDPSDGNRLYLACGTYTNQWGTDGAILSSRDRGRTFTRFDLPFKLGGNENGRSMGERLAVDPKHSNIIYFGTRSNGLWVSDDSGKSFNQLSTFAATDLAKGIGITSEAFDARDKDRSKRTQSIYVGVASRGTNLYHSADGGATWTALAGLPKGLFVHHLVAEEGKLYATLTNGPGPNGVSDGAVYRLDIDAGKWTDITPAVPNRGNEKGFGYAGLSVHRTTVAVSTLDRWSPGDDVFYSTDSGATWTSLRSNSHMDSTAAPYMTWGQPSPKFGWWIGTVAVDPFDHGRVLYGTGANIWGCEDVLPNNVGLPITWKVCGTGIEETADIDLLSPLAGPPLITALGDIGGFTHQDLNRVPSGMALNPLLSNTDSLSASGSGNLIVKVGRPNAGEAPGGYSKDNGITWKPFASMPFRSANGGSAAVSMDGGIIVWSPNRTSPFWSDDDGTTWRQSELSGGGGLQLVADSQDVNTFYGLASSGQTYVSIDGGRSFKPTSAAPIKGDHGSLRASPNKKGKLYLPTAKALLVSDDGGNSFTPMAGVDAADSLGFGKARDGATEPTLFLNGRVAGVDGVYRSDDSGQSWVRISDRDHEYGTRGVVIGDPRVYGRVYMGTNGRGVLIGEPATNGGQ